MSNLSLTLPESLHNQILDIAEKEGISVDQFVASALAEKLSALLAEDYLEGRARRASRERFEAILAKVPDIDPDPQDRLP